MKSLIERRHFFKKIASVVYGLNLLTSEVFGHGFEELKIKKTVDSDKRIKVYGKIFFKDIEPSEQLDIQISHSNSATKPNTFAIEKIIKTDQFGNYSFEIETLQKHFEKGTYKMKRVFIKIKDNSGVKINTCLFFDTMGYAHVHSDHVNNAFDVQNLLLPKTIINDKINIVRFDINIATKGEASCA